MPNILDIRRRIRSVKNTQQITRAMKMVAAARLRRAVERVVNARPYANQLRAMIRSVAARTAERSHPLLATRPVEKVLLVLVTADRGLCGAFNSNLIRAAQTYLAEHRTLEVSLLCVGRKGRDFFRKRGAAITAEYVNIFAGLGYAQAQEIAERIRELYASEAVDAVDVIYNEYKSAMVQRLTVERFLPIAPIEPAATAPASGSAPLVDYIYEQPPEELFKALLYRYADVEIYRALIESAAAEFAAKMTAMGAATENAAEMIDHLTLTMNRIRQAAITKEIIEIVSGAASV
ncbi:MAG: ATP synthase F1 subunit gamma [Acidobacteria bacterium]|nr:MAG: ATP synthase F1 subunit gamma [Acidobacteriota bacterium]